MGREEDGEGGGWGGRRMGREEDVGVVVCGGNREIDGHNGTVFVVGSGIGSWLCQEEWVMVGGMEYVAWAGGGMGFVTRSRQMLKRISQSRHNREGCLATMHFLNRDIVEAVSCFPLSIDKLLAGIALERGELRKTVE